MVKRTLFLWAMMVVLAPASAWGFPPLQLFVDLTPAGGVLRPPPGIYSGPVVISRPITIDGEGQVTIDGGGSGTVLSVRADGAILRGLHVTNSGKSHDQVDAGVLLEAHDAIVEGNVIDDVLFGIHVKKSDGNRIRRNRISSITGEPSLRGEGIRMWYSYENIIEDNEIVGVRDLVFSNSAENRIAGNVIRDSRMGMELVFSPDNDIENNRISGNLKGIVALYSDDLRIHGNRLEHMRDFAGSALAIKESSGVVIEGNEVLHCAVGMVANSPTHPENVLHLKGNRFAFNDVALYFYGEKGGHVIRGNRFEHNFTAVAVSASSSARANDWRGNYWSDYEGFDTDADGNGDQPFDVLVYADRIWMDRPFTRFFRGSPVLELVDFMERLAPFAPPQVILSDPEPLLQ